MDLLLNAIKKTKKKQEETKKHIIGKKRKRFVQIGDIDKYNSKKYYENQTLENESKRRKVFSTPPPTERPKEEVRLKIDISLTEIKRLLRTLGEPVTLFGETGEQRLKRYRHLVSNKEEEKRVSKKYESVGYVDYLRHHEESEKKLFKTTEEISYDNQMKGEIEKLFGDSELPKQKRDESQSEYILCIFYRLLHDWEINLIKCRNSSVEYRKERETHIQCKEYIQPLIKRLVNKSLSKDLVFPIYQIVKELKKREYIKANSLFLKLSIGNAPWPMGVTNVGIHARSSNQSIRSDQIAHVLNDEIKRKYIQSIKRLITFAQKKYPSKKTW